MTRRIRGGAIFKEYDLTQLSRAILKTPMRIPFNVLNTGLKYAHKKLTGKDLGLTLEAEEAAGDGDALLVLDDIMEGEIPPVILPDDYKQFASFVPESPISKVYIDYYTMGVADTSDLGRSVNSEFIRSLKVLFVGLSAPAAPTIGVLDEQGYSLEVGEILEGIKNVCALILNIAVKRYAASILESREAWPGILGRYCSGKSGSAPLIGMLKAELADIEELRVIREGDDTFLNLAVVGTADEAVNPAIEEGRITTLNNLKKTYLFGGDKKKKDSVCESYAARASSEAERAVQVAELKQAAAAAAASAAAAERRAAAERARVARLVQGRNPAAVAAARERAEEAEARAAAAAAARAAAAERAAPALRGRGSLELVQAEREARGQHRRAMEVAEAAAERGAAARAAAEAEVRAALAAEAQVQAEAGAGGRGGDAEAEADRLRAARAAVEVARAARDEVDRAVERDAWLMDAARQARIRRDGAERAREAAEILKPPPAPTYVLQPKGYVETEVSRARLAAARERERAAARARAPPRAAPAPAAAVQQRPSFFRRLFGRREAAAAAPAVEPQPSLYSRIFRRRRGDVLLGEEGGGGSRKRSKRSSKNRTRKH